MRRDTMMTRDELMKVIDNVFDSYPHGELKELRAEIKEVVNIFAEEMDDLVHDLNLLILQKKNFTVVK